MYKRQGLYQIDLLNGSKGRITEREYWAAKKGQLALDKENAARAVSYTHLDVYKRQEEYRKGSKEKSCEINEELSYDPTQEWIDSICLLYTSRCV